MEIYLEDEPYAPRDTRDEEEETADHPCALGVWRVVSLGLGMVE